MKHYDYLIVGAGLYGATFARLATDRGKKCLVIDRRKYIGGNLYCKQIEGITVHYYGPHIFHTSDKQVWDFVNSITPFTPFINQPLARYRNHLYNLPFNMNTFHQIWGCFRPEHALSMINQQRQDALLRMQRDGVSEPRNLEEQALLLVGRDIYEILIKGYTEKQWGRPCSELPAFIIRRLPVRMTYDNNYFDDIYQGIPIKGYTVFIEKLLEGVDCELNVDFFADRSYLESKADKIVYTGPIDQFFDYSEGTLMWRTLKFNHEVMCTSNYQGTAIVNYTEACVPFTRIIEHKHFLRCVPTIAHDKTVVTFEYPANYVGKDPYYPINDEHNMQIYESYQKLAASEPNVHFGGRLAEYKYYDMDDVVAKVLQLFQ